MTYALQVDETHAAGETVEVNAGGDVVATLTFGFAGGAEFSKAAADGSVEGMVAYTPGNGQNGKPGEGTVYIINPKYDGKVEVGVVLNSDKAFYVLENETALADYNGITVAEKYYGTYTFKVVGGKEYKVYCTGSKLGFYGFNYTYNEADDDEGEQPGEEQPGVENGTVVLSWVENDMTLSSKTTEDMTNTGTSNNVATWSNGYSIMIMRSDKGHSSAKAITVDGKGYTAIKVSNGAQNKLILPEGKVTKKITLYSYVNVDAPTNRVSYWKEVAGQTYTEDDVFESYNDHANPDKREYTFVEATNEVTFTNTGEQCCYVLFVEIESGTSTGINTVGAQAESGVIYNLQGQKVTAPKAGLYIIDGKKVILK